MKKLKINELVYTNFKSFGVFEEMINPKTEKICGAENIEFYRDMILLRLGQGNSASFSVCRVSKSEPVVKIIEYHSYTEESIFPVDGDIAVLVGPAMPRDKIPADKFEVFRIPCGTMVILKSGVWHSGPFVLNTDIVNILVTLPERTYANDCIVEKLNTENQIRIIGI